MDMIFVMYLFLKSMYGILILDQSQFFLENGWLIWAKSIPEQSTQSLPAKSEHERKNIMGNAI